MTPRIICLEEHITDPDLAEAARPLVAQQSPYMRGLGSRLREEPDPTSGRPTFVAPQTAAALSAGGIDARIATMDEAGIDVQVLSYAHPTIAVTPALARAANDRMAAMVGRHPQRLAGFSTLPWGDPEAAAGEAERCADQLGLRGTMLVGRPAEDGFVDDARFSPVLDALARLGSPLYIHPGPPLPAVQGPYYGGFNEEVTARLSLYGWGWHAEAGVQLLRLILSGGLDRNRSLRIISGHWGEMVPFFLKRLDDALPTAATRLGRSIGAAYRDQVTVTPSGMLDLANFLFCREVLGVQRMLFSVDYPYLTMTGARAWLDRLPVGEEERVALASGNFERLIPSFAGSP